MLTHDKSGARFPSQYVETKTPVQITDRDIYGTLEPLNLHGPLFTSYIREFGSYYRENLDYIVRRLGWFSTSSNITFESQTGGPIVDRPAQQFPEPPYTPRRSQMILHELNARGIRILKAADRYHRIQHTGWWGHKVANACVTASLQLAALKEGLTFIAPDYITDDIGVVVPYTTPEGYDIDDQKLYPDYLMGIGNKDQRRYFAVETDLGNEVGKPGQRKQADDDEEAFRTRKSFDRMVRQYHGLIAKGLYKEAYRIDRGLLLLFLTKKKSKLNLMMQIVDELSGGRGFNWLLLRLLSPDAYSAFKKPKPLYHLWTEPWERVGNTPFYLNNPTRQ